MLIYHEVCLGFQLSGKWEQVHRSHSFVDLKIQKREVSWHVKLFMGEEKNTIEQLLFI